MQKAIIDNLTGVVKRLTTDENPQIDSSETVIVLTKDLDLSGGFFTLDQQENKIPATQDQIDKANVDENLIAQKRKMKIENLQNSIDLVIADKSLPSSLLLYFQSLKDLN